MLDLTEHPVQSMVLGLKCVAGTLCALCSLQSPWLVGVLLGSGGSRGGVCSVTLLLYAHVFLHMLCSNLA